jgi:hypothetical protein
MTGYKCIEWGALTAILLEKGSAKTLLLGSIPIIP